jgi:hypothetical protein
VRTRAGHSDKAVARLPRHERSEWSGRRGLSSLVPSTLLNSVIGSRRAQAAGNNRNATGLGCVLGSLRR